MSTDRKPNLDALLRPVDPCDGARGSRRRRLSAPNARPSHVGLASLAGHYCQRSTSTPEGSQASLGPGRLPSAPFLHRPMPTPPRPVFILGPVTHSSPAAPTQPMAVPAAGRRIAVIEDEASIAAAIATRLRSEGYEVEIAGDGPGGVELCERFRPDLVVLDLMLPGLDGIEVCKQIQRERPLPVLMLTARDSETDLLVGLGGRRRRLHDEAVQRARARCARPRAAAARRPSGHRRRRALGAHRRDRARRGRRAACAATASSCTSRRSSSTCCNTSRRVRAGSRAARSCS